LLPIARKVSVAEDIPERIGIGFPDIEDAVDAARKTRTVASNVSKTTVQASPSTKLKQRAGRPKQKVNLTNDSMESANRKD
jgi:hypothetical protein